MSKVKIREYALPPIIQAMQRVGQKEIPVKYSRLYAELLEDQERENKALVVAHKQLQDRLNAVNPDVKKEASDELEAYLDQEIEVKLLPHDFLNQVTAIAPVDLVVVKKLMAEPPCRGV